MTAFSDREAEILAYCRIDDPAPEELALLEALYSAAVSRMSNAGVAEPESGSARLAQYNLCVDALVLDAYDNRSISAAGSSMADNPAFRRMLNQLKHTEPSAVPESDTEA